MAHMLESLLESRKLPPGGRAAVFGGGPFGLVRPLGDPPRTRLNLRSQALALGRATDDIKYIYIYIYRDREMRCMIFASYICTYVYIQTQPCVIYRYVQIEIETKTDIKMLVQIQIDI